MIWGIDYDDWSSFSLFWICQWFTWRFFLPPMASTSFPQWPSPLWSICDLRTPLHYRLRQLYAPKQHLGSAHWAPGDGACRCSAAALFWTRLRRCGSGRNLGGLRIHEGLGQSSVALPRWLKRAGTLERVVIWSPWLSGAETGTSGTVEQVESVGQPTMFPYVPESWARKPVESDLKTKKRL